MLCPHFCQSREGLRPRTTGPALPQPIPATLAIVLATLHVWVCFIFISVLMTSPSPQVLGEIRRLRTFAFEHPGAQHQETVESREAPLDTAASASAITAPF